MSESDETREIRLSTQVRVPVQVLGCLRRTHITVILCPEVGLVDGEVKIEVPIEIIPTDLRMPNSEFDMIFDKQEKALTNVVRKDKPSADA